MSHRMEQWSYVVQVVWLLIVTGVGSWHIAQSYVTLSEFWRVVLFVTLVVVTGMTIEEIFGRRNKEG